MLGDGGLDSALPGQIPLPLSRFPSVEAQPRQTVPGASFHPPTRGLGQPRMPQPGPVRVVPIFFHSWSAIKHGWAFPSCHIYLLISQILPRMWRAWDRGTHRTCPTWGGGGSREGSSEERGPQGALVLRNRQLRSPRPQAPEASPDPFSSVQFPASHLPRTL